MVYQMCKSTGQSRNYIEDNYTLEEIAEWFQFEQYESYVQRKLTEKK